MAVRPRSLAVGLAGVAYVAASQWLMTRTPPPPWSAMALLLPVLAMAAIGAWRAGRRAVALLAIGASLTLVVQAATGGGFSVEQLWLLQHVGAHLGLAVWFAMTLAPGSMALITRLAQRVHGGLTPALARYTRRVTLAWAVYFAAMAAISVVLYALAPFAWWASFANLLTPLTAVLMFVGEFALRYRLHPEFERATMAQALGAYAEHRRAAPTGRSAP